MQVQIPERMLTTEMLGYRAQRMSVVTYNVTSDKVSNRVRHPKILSLLEAQRPDFILLQEVTPSLLQKLLEQPWARQSYFLSDISGATFGEHKIGQVRALRTERP